MKNFNINKAITASLLVFLALTTSCYYDAVVPPEGPETVSYSADVQPYFDNKCVSCHDGSGAPLNLEATVSYDNLLNGGNPAYINIADPGTSLLYTKIATGGSMEPFSTAQETAMILQWIEAGAENN